MMTNGASAGLSPIWMITTTIPLFDKNLRYKIVSAYIFKLKCLFKPLPGDFEIDEESPDEEERRARAALRTPEPEDNVPTQQKVCKLFEPLQL